MSRVLPRGVWLGLVLGAGMASLWPGVGAQEAPAPEAPPVASLELLDATLYVQVSAEYRATAFQAYAQARAQLDAALADPTWTAALEQLDDVSGLPPAVILDVDETCLDNSEYEARLIRDGTSYGSETWDPWCLEASAQPVPGAVAFCNYAHARGVRVFYVTNRRAHLGDATAQNLRARGFPVAAGSVLPRTDTSDKGPRRRTVASEHRVLLLIGDNAGDFASCYDVESNTQRLRLADDHRDLWGSRWIVLPNPMYGKWLLNTTAHTSGELSPQAALAHRVRALRFDPER